MVPRVFRRKRRRPATSPRRSAARRPVRAQTEGCRRSSAEIPVSSNSARTPRRSAASMGQNRRHRADGADPAASQISVAKASTSKRRNDRMESRSRTTSCAWGSRSWRPGEGNPGNSELPQGVKINDKHIEMIIRQMPCARSKSPTVATLSCRRAGRAPATVSKEKALRQNEILAKGRAGAAGITKASWRPRRSSPSASFQETTSVLTGGRGGAAPAIPRPASRKRHRPAA